MGQNRGFYQGRNLEFFLHKNIWEFYEFVPPVPIIMHSIDNLTAESHQIFCGTKVVSLLLTGAHKWSETVSEPKHWAPVAPTLKIPFPTQWPTVVTGHLNITVQSSLRDQKLCRTNTAFITCLIPKFPFSKILSVFKAIIRYNDQSCGRVLIQVISTFLRLFCLGRRNEGSAAPSVSNTMQCSKQELHSLDSNLQPICRQ